MKIKSSLALVPPGKTKKNLTQRRKETRLSQVLDGSRLLSTGRSSVLRRMRDSSPPNLSSSFCDLCTARLFRFFCLYLCAFASLREIF